MKRLLLLLLPLAVLSACSPTGPTSSTPDTKVIEHTAGNVRDYMPLTKGNSWTFTVTGLMRVPGKQPAGGTTKSTIKVTDVKETPNGRRGEASIFNGDKLMSRIAFLANDKGIYQIGAYGNKVKAEYNPPVPMVLLPAKPGQKFPYKGTGVLPGLDAQGALTGEMTFKGESMVDTNAGRMKALRFDALQKYTRNGKSYEAAQSAWFVPKVGLVRSVEIVKAPEFVRTIEMKLESYTVK